MKRVAPVFLLLLAAAPVSRAVESDRPLPPLAQEIQKSHPRLFELTVKEGARIHRTADGKSYYLAWFPPELEGQARPPAIVTLHGDRRSAFDEFEAWLPHARERGYGLLCLQWQIKDGKRRRDYLPPEIHLVLQDLCLREGIQPGRALLHGFHRGACVIYSIANLDRFEGRGFFAATIADAGAALPDYPQNLRIRERAKNGELPFEGTRWIFYCAEEDRSAPFAGCDEIRGAAEWVRQLGGEELLFIEQGKGDPPGLRRSPADVGRALDSFERLMADQASS